VNNRKEQADGDFLDENMDRKTEENFIIRRLRTREETETCTIMMAGSEPRITLGRDYVASLETLSAPTKEVYLALIGKEIVGYTILNMHGAFIDYFQIMCLSSTWRGKGFGSKLINLLRTNFCGKLQMYSSAYLHSTAGLNGYMSV
jgi:hypothetical protein